MKIRRLITILLVISIVLSSFSVSAETLFSDSSTVSAELVDSREITSPFSSITAWKEHLQAENVSLSKADLSHDAIQSVLKKRGLSGLSKYQYFMLLEEEGLNDYVNNHLLVTFKDGVNSFQSDVLNNLISSKELIADLFYKITLKEKYSEPAFMELLKQVIEDSNVAMAQPDFVCFFTGYEAKHDYEVSTMSAALEQVNATGAWRYGESNNVVVGMIDSGADDVGQNLNPNSVADCPISEGHGTAVSSVISGSTNIPGVDPNASIFCLGGCNACAQLAAGNTTSHGSNCGWTSSSIVDDIFQLVNQEYCSIINLSIDTSSATNYFYDVITNYEDILFVQSAGNDGINLNSQVNTYTYYSKPNFIFVASVDCYDNLSDFSNYGSNVVHIAAPGEDLLLPGADGSFYYFSGTSFAAPFVAGAAAKLWDVNYYLFASEVKDILLSTADAIPELQGKVQGARRLNVGAAVASLSPANSDRYAYIDASGVLRCKNGASSSWTQVTTGVSLINFNFRDTYLLKTSGTVSHINANTFGPLGGVEYLENATSFAAYGDFVVTLDSSNTMRIHRYVDYAMEFSTFYTVENVKTFTLSGNLLAYCFNSAPHLLYYHPNIAKWTSYGIEAFSVGVTINSMFSTGPRIHLLCANNSYRAYEYGRVGNTQDLYNIITDNNMSSYVLSISYNRWIQAVGSNLYVYKWDANGTRQPMGTIAAPNGQSIINCKAIGNWISFTTSGGNFYGVEGYTSGKAATLLASNVVGNACANRMVGIIKADGSCYTKKGSLTAPWTQHTTSGAKKLYIAP